MATKKITPPQFTDAAATYLERLECGHTRFAAAIGTARERGARVTDKLVENLLATQRDSLQLGKTLAAQPTAYGKNVEAFLHALTTAQERSFELAKTIYRTHSEIASNARAAAASALERSKTLANPFQPLASFWMFNPK